MLCHIWIDNATACRAFRQKREAARATKSHDELVRPSDTPCDNANRIRMRFNESSRKRVQRLEELLKHSQDTSSNEKLDAERD